MGVVGCSWLGMEVGCNEMFEEDWVVPMNETDLLDGIFQYFGGSQDRW
jgi:hypothetical protein